MGISEHHPGLPSIVGKRCYSVIVIDIYLEETREIAVCLCPISLPHVQIKVLIQRIKNHGRPASLYGQQA